LHDSGSPSKLIEPADGVVSELVKPSYVVEEFDSVDSSWHGHSSGKWWGIGHHVPIGASPAIICTLWLWSCPVNAIPVGGVGHHPADLGIGGGAVGGVAEDTG